MDVPRTVLSVAQGQEEARQNSCFSNAWLCCALSPGLTSTQSVIGLETDKWGHIDQLFIHNTQGIGGLYLWVLTSVHHSHFVFESLLFSSSLVIPKITCLRS